MKSATTEDTPIALGDQKVSKLAAGDLSGDGRSDLMISHRNAHTLLMFTHRTSGATFTTPPATLNVGNPNVSASTNYATPAIGALLKNGDGRDYFFAVQAPSYACVVLRKGVVVPDCGTGYVCSVQHEAFDECRFIFNPNISNGNVHIALDVAAAPWEADLDVITHLEVVVRKEEVPGAGYPDRTSVRHHKYLIPNDPQPEHTWTIWFETDEELDPEGDPFCFANRYFMRVGPVTIDGSGNITYSAHRYVIGITGDFDEEEANGSFEHLTDIQGAWEAGIPYEVIPNFTDGRVPVGGAIGQTRIPFNPGDIPVISPSAPTPLSLL